MVPPNAVAARARDRLDELLVLGDLAEGRRPRLVTLSQWETNSWSIIGGEFGDRHRDLTSVPSFILSDRRPPP